MKSNKMNTTVAAVRERERESKRIEKTCSAFDAENRSIVEQKRCVNNVSVNINDVRLGYVRIAECY